MKFSKYHGLGNDFIIVDNVDGSISITGANAEAMCNRHFGIGADGLILVEKSKKADIKMIIYNSDGSRAEMCGNGVRCFAKYVYDNNIVANNIIDVETDAGVMVIEVKVNGDNAEAVVVNMGKPDFTPANVPVLIDNTEVVNHEIDIEGTKLNITSMLLGVPHTVMFVDSLDDEYIIKQGKLVENAHYFPRTTNVNFVKVIDRDTIAMRTWERGAGYTYACGTGACACVAAGIANGLVNDKVKVQLRGGDLIIHWKDGGNIFMEGPATMVFEGTYLIC